MEQIDDVKLDELVAEASSELLDQRRKQASSAVKQILQRTEQLARDIKNLKGQVAKKQGKLDFALARIEKLKKGDWSVLQDKQEQPDGK